jgi:hypothetical protein
VGLYDLDGWRVAAFVAGIVVLSLLMVESMMQFTSALLERPPTRRQRNALALEVLSNALIALHGDGYAVEQRGRAGLAVRWDALRGAVAPPGTRFKLTADWKTRMLLDARRREARWYESVRTSSVFVGFTGLRPLFSFGWYYQGGYLSGVWSGTAYLVTDDFPPKIIDARSFEIDTDALREAFIDIVTSAGWTFRPVTLPFYTSPRWLSLTQRVVPGRLATVPRRRLWGIVYPTVFFLLIAFILAPLERLSLGDALIVLLVICAWWGVWGLLAWLLSRTPRTRRKARRR